MMYIALVPLYNDLSVGIQPKEIRDPAGSRLSLLTSQFLDIYNITAYKIDPNNVVTTTISEDSVIIIDSSEATPESLDGELVLIFDFEQRKIVLRRIMQTSQGWCRHRKVGAEFQIIIEKGIL